MKITDTIVFAIIMSCAAIPGHATTTLTYGYDANGNLTSGEGKFYEYNDANQLVKIRQGNATGPVIAEYFYDFNGQRVKKVESGVTTYYIGKHFETRVTGEGPGKTTTNTSYYFANGERVAKKDPSGKMSYIHSDHLGGTNAVTDESGNLVERTKYYPFGEIREGGSERYTYTGKEKDKLTGWYYYEARYYNPQSRHFTQADSVEPDYYDPQNLNRYAYVINNPIKHIDPTGNSYVDSHGRTWQTKSNYKRYQKTVSNYEQTRKKNVKSEMFLTVAKELQIIEGFGDMSMSILSGDYKGLLKGGGDTILAFLDLGGIEAPKNIADIPGYFATKYNFKYAKQITFASHAIDTGFSIMSMSDNAKIFHSSFDQYKSFKNLNLTVPALNYCYSAIESISNIQTLTK